MLALAEMFLPGLVTTAMHYAPAGWETTVGATVLLLLIAVFANIVSLLAILMRKIAAAPFVFIYNTFFVSETHQTGTDEHDCTECRYGEGRGRHANRSPSGRR